MRDDELERRILALLQSRKKGLSYLQIAKRLDMPESRVLAAMYDLRGDHRVALAEGLWKVRPRVPTLELVAGEYWCSECREAFRIAPTPGSLGKTLEQKQIHREKLFQEHLRQVHRPKAS